MSEDAVTGPDRVRWIAEASVDGPPSVRPRSRAAGSVLGAAMLAVGRIIEPSKTRVEITVEAVVPTDDPLAALGVDIDFGSLPGLG